MPRIPRGQVAGQAYHVLNRGNGGAAVFHKDVAGRLSIHFVVASDVEQDNFSLGYTKHQCHAVGMRDTHGMKSFEFSAERMQSKGR